MVEKAWRNGHLADTKFDSIKIHRTEKIYHEHFTPYYIWLPNGVPNDTNSKIGNRSMALGSCKKLTYMKTLYLFSIDIP